MQEEKAQRESNLPRATQLSVVGRWMEPRLFRNQLLLPLKEEF